MYSLGGLYDEKEKTSAIGSPPWMAATQGGNWDKTLSSVILLSTKFNPNLIEDARDTAFNDVKELSFWKKNDATGVHAEVLIIRAWIIKMVTEQKMSLEKAIQNLKGRKIEASQKPCWCCYKLMHSYGIMCDNLGNKPRTGWRHPLGTKTIPNSEIPNSFQNITEEWLNAASQY